jgi:predicted MFS family arabinose efflux permease
MNLFSKLVWLAVGAFAIGTEGYVVAGLLPDLAADLHVSVALAGQLITVFALAYALGSPVLAVVTGAMERRRLLIVALAAFAIFNLLAAVAHSYVLLMLARVGLALSAGTFMPAASAYAVAAFPAAQRGRALSVIYGGFTVALVLGAPLGVTLGAHLGWRFIFIGVAAAALVALTGLSLTLSRQKAGATVSIPERVAVARRPEILAALSVTVLALTGVYAIYSFLAPLLERAAHVGGDTVALMLFVFGLGGVIGNACSGSATDRFGAKRVLTFVLLGLAVLFTMLALTVAWVTPAVAFWVLLPLLGAWGFTGFSFPASQQTLLVSLAPKFAPITLSLNSSAIYLGVSLGTALGSMFVAQGGIGNLGWVGAGCEVVAFFVLRFGPRRRRVPDEDRGTSFESHVTELA